MTKGNTLSKFKGELIMGSEYGFKVDGWGTGWGGQQSNMAEARRLGRLNKLKALLDALSAGNIVDAQKAILDLWAFDNSLKTDTYLLQINDELSKKQLYFAQKTARSMQADISHFSASLQLRAKAPIEQGLKAGQISEHSQNEPKKATTGEFGRLVDVSA